MSGVEGLVFQLLTLLLLVTMAASELEPPSNIQLRNYSGDLVALWNWDDDTVVNFTALYHKSGTAAAPIPGCVHTKQCICHIPPQLLDVTGRYTLLVRSELAEEHSPPTSIAFTPHLIEIVPPPSTSVVFDDGIVVVNISPSHQYSSYNPADAYVIVLHSNDSSVELTSHTRRFLIPQTSPGVTYCIKVKLVDMFYALHTSFSPAKCFTTPTGSPENLKVKAIDLKYLLTWDWDHDRYPNVTFSVRTRMEPNGWNSLASCQNITATECDVSGLYIYGTHVLRAFVYDSQRDVLNYSEVTFKPLDEMVPGPPTNINTTNLSNDLYITMDAPEGFKNSDFRSVCDWMYHLEFWDNSTTNQVTHMEKKDPNFHIKGLNDSTTYCMTAHTKCHDRHTNRTGLNSSRCITTGPRFYMTEWITGSIFVGIIVISVVVYICLCPLKRYMKHIFFPSSKLPSSIGKDIQYSSQNLIRVPFSLNKEETFDKCYIIQHIEPEIQVPSDKKSQDSGNYSNEDELTGETNICTS